MKIASTMNLESEPRIAEIWCTYFHHLPPPPLRLHPLLLPFLQNRLRHHRPPSCRCKWQKDLKIYFYLMSDLNGKIIVVNGRET